MNDHKLGLAVIAASALLAVPFLIWHGSRELSDFSGQGGSEPALARKGAELQRGDDGIHISVVVPTPQPGTYEYPTGDMVPPGRSHPDVEMGSEDEPEVFTLWAFVFNYPANCTDNACDFDDIGDTEAKGGVFQLGAWIADEPFLELHGGVRLGQTPVNGVSLENPMGAEVHTGLAPHGKALSGDDLWAQLNGPIGNVTLWWAASFPAG